MKRLEDDLRWALARRDPPAGFADRVMARIPKQPPRRSWFASLRPAFAVFTLVLIAGGSLEYHRVQKQKEGERAAQELMYALQVTSAKLHLTRTKLLERTGGAL